MSTRTPRVPPGLWTALVWCAAAVWPIVEYVIHPPQQGYSLSYPRDGLDPWGAKALLALAFALVLAGSALLRRRTVVAFGLVVAGTVVSTLAWRQDEIPPAQFVGVAVALGYVAAVLPRRRSLAAAGGAVAVLGGYLVARTLAGGGSGIAAEPYVALLVVIAWLAGHSVFQARAHTAELHARAAAEAVTAERLRIAREMHDTVAHSIGIIALQAGAAVRVAESQPARAREAMLAVEEAGRETLAGLRRMLGALRQAEDAGGAALGGGLAEVDRLAAATTAAGVRVAVERRGRQRPLPPDVDLAAFRIVQEAVANVVRHSGADACRVSLAYGADALAVEVADRGTGGGGTGGGGTGDGSERGQGFGLAGMRERVALLRGEFAAGPRPGGGFVVAARLPTPTAPTTARTSVAPGAEVA